MAIKEILDKIRKALPEDTGEQIKEWLADASNEAGIMADAISARNRENERLRKAKEELEQKLQEYSSSADVLKKKDEELQQLKNKLAEIELREKQNLEKQWNDISKVFTIPETDKRFTQIQKVKNHFKFPEEGKQLTMEEIKENLKVYQVLADAGILTEKEPVPEPSTKPPITPQTQQIPMDAGEAILQKLKNKTR